MFLLFLSADSYLVNNHATMILQNGALSKNKTTIAKWLTVADRHSGFCHRVISHFHTVYTGISYPNTFWLQDGCCNQVMLFFEYNFSFIRVTQAAFISGFTYFDMYSCIFIYKDMVINTDQEYMCI